MMNDDNPLIEAMARPNKKMPMMTRETLTADLPDAEVGDAVELSVLGVVKSTQDGRAIVEVQKVEEEQDDMQQVLTQESHVPS